MGIKIQDGWLAGHAPLAGWDFYEEPMAEPSQSLPVHISHTHTFQHVHFISN